MKVLNFNDPYIDSKGNVNNLGDMLSGELASQLVTNLLNPTLQSQVDNGIICTANSDGTFTLNGTATDTARFILQSNITYFDGLLKLVGSPSGGLVDGKTLYKIDIIDKDGGIYCSDTGDGVIKNYEKGVKYNYVRIVVYKDTILNNAVFKPMLTSNLSAQYSDFVQYTGTTNTLNGDVAEVIKSIPFVQTVTQLLVTPVDGWTTVDVVFPKPYKSIPLVTVYQYDTGTATAWSLPMIKNLTNTGFTFGWWNVSGAARQVMWQAIGV